MYLKSTTVYIILLLNAVLSYGLYYFEINLHSGYFLLSLTIWITSLFLCLDNIILCTRQFFLGVIGHLSGAVKVIDSYAIFGFHMTESQTLEIASLMLYMTNVALFFSYFFFVLADSFSVKKSKKFTNENVYFFWVSLSFLAIVAVVLDASFGSSIIFGPGYGLEDKKLETGINNLNTISISLTLFCFIIYFKMVENGENTKLQRTLLIATTIYLYLIVYFLHGVRMDAINGIFGLFIVHRLLRRKNLSVTPKLTILILLSFLFVQVLGLVRSNIDSLSISTVLNVFDNIRNGSSSGVLLYQGTVNDLATTFSGIIYLVNNYGLEHLYGQSYFDWILRTPPSFIYPERPKDLSWIFSDLGFSSGGGFFELSEAYYNFGFYGAILVPSIISFVIALSLKIYRHNTMSVSSSLLLISILSVLLRGFLYQSFAFYKSFVTVCILYAVVLVSSEILRKICSNK